MMAVLHGYWLAEHIIRAIAKTLHQNIWKTLRKWRGLNMYALENKQIFTNLKMSFGGVKFITDKSQQFNTFKNQFH